MPTVRAFPDAVTTVDTAAQYELGTIWEMDAAEAEELDSTVAGPQRWVYVFNDEASTAWAAGNVVALDASTVNYDGILAPVDAPAVRLLGVAQHAIAAGSYGWILERGFGEVLAGTGGITANTPLTVNDTDAGTALDGSATESCFAFATEAATATNTATCLISIS
ncbi:MAG: hypothetical protein P1V36_00185 [Planctomycetota bacterium]|nr:hypothetical protein [Planctomycetota bacterium]